MTAAELLARAHKAGLTVAQEDGTLRIRGPRAAGEIARQLVDRKGDVLRELALTALRGACGDIEILAWHDSTRLPPGSIDAEASPRERPCEYRPCGQPGTRHRHGIWCDKHARKMEIQP